MLSLFFEGGAEGFSGSSSSSPQQAKARYPPPHPRCGQGHPTPEIQTPFHRGKGWAVRVVSRPLIRRAACCSPGVPRPILIFGNNHQVFCKSLGYTSKSFKNRPILSPQIPGDSGHRTVAVIHSVGTEGLWVSLGSCSALPPGSQRVTAKERRFAHTPHPHSSGMPGLLCLTVVANHQELWARQLQSWGGEGDTLGLWQLCVGAEAHPSSGGKRRRGPQGGWGSSQLIEAQPRVLGFQPSRAAESRRPLNLLRSAGPAPRSPGGLVVFVQL